MTAPAGNSTYERWVLTLRSWAASPETTSLAGLPTLTDDTFTPDTYRRLIDHVLAAMRAANERWHEGLTRAFTTSSTPFELARELVSLRTTLARRVQLAQHPGLPEAIRTILMDNLTADVDRYQREAEEAIGRSTSATSLDTSWRDSMLAVLRENSFRAALTYDVSGDRPAAPSLPPPSVAPPAAGRAATPARRGFRRVFPTSES